MSTSHKRNVGSMLASRRCGARTRAGGQCLAPAISGSFRCRMHGGKGSGAPKKNKNALKHGWYTAEMRQTRRSMAELVRSLEEDLEDIRTR